MTAPLKEWLGEQDGDDLNGSAGKKVLEALRAVVELHQSVGITVEPVVEGIVVVDQVPVERCACGWEWPCPTIRAIEKEVKP